ncbi:unnamed protein product, partial [Peniophora sp. CBMAI 1063]
MSSRPPPAPVLEDHPMRGDEEEQEDDGEGDRASDDSSGEAEEDKKEEKRVREGFIVDEDEDEEEEEEDRPKKKKREHRKHRHRHHDEDAEGGLEDDDLDLMEENTGEQFKRSKLKRLRHGRESDSPPAASSSKRRNAVLSDDDLDAEDLELPSRGGINDIWAEDEDEDDFIDCDEEEEGAGGMDEAEREQLRREKRRQENERRQAMRSRPELSGIDPAAWDEILEVFGDGHDCNWALEGEEEDEYQEAAAGKEMNYQDVFEPSEIRARLTEDDDIIRAQDVPERMQLATSTLSKDASLSVQHPMSEEMPDDAAMWCLMRLNNRKEREFFRPDGQYHTYLDDLVSAITDVLRFIFVSLYEVPYIWTHKRDSITSIKPEIARQSVNLLNQEELWRIQMLGQKYLSLTERRQALVTKFQALGVNDEYFETDIQEKLDSVETVADVTEWLPMQYKASKGKASKAVNELRFHDDELMAEAAPVKEKRKLPNRTSDYDVAKQSIVAKLAKGFGAKAEEIAINCISASRVNWPTDPDIMPLALADQFVDPDPAKAQNPADLFKRARMIMATELGKDLILRHEIRQVFKNRATISIAPTERGVSKIDNHPYYAFEYLYRKPVIEMLESPDFLHILAAEKELLVIVTFALPDEVRGEFEKKLSDAMVADSFTDASNFWSDERRRVVVEALDQHLLAAGAKHARDALRERVDVAPLAIPSPEPGQIPNVVAMSWGKGDPQEDAISIVFTDEMGRLREHAKIDNLNDTDFREEFKDLLIRRKPDCIIIGGFSVATLKLSLRVKELLQGTSEQAEGQGSSSKEQEDLSTIPVFYGQDEVARIFQHSKRADEEFTGASAIAKYWIGLARYVQSPLNEYAALASDITAITFEEDHQPLIPKEKLLYALEHVLVGVVNKVGVDINRCVTDSYYAGLLPFVAGLGPRKADALIKKIAQLGGTLSNREQFVKAGLMATSIFLNSAPFLCIPQDGGSRSSKHRNNDDMDTQDPLDDTRIHPEDYDLARKMATDALDTDEEDFQGEHASQPVTELSKEREVTRELDELNLDEFALSLPESSGERKRHMLSIIRSELIAPFSETRPPLQPPGDRDVITMLTGETPRTLKNGVIVSVLVQRIRPNFINVRMDSGIEAVINTVYLTDNAAAPVNVDSIVKKGQTMPGVIIQVRPELSQDHIFVELSARPGDIAAGDSQFGRVKADEKYWNHSQAERDQEILVRKKRADKDKTRRLVKHPHFHNFNSAQAEQYLAKQQRGDVVIRPSSKGFNHL